MVDRLALFAKVHVVKAIGNHRAVVISNLNKVRESFMFFFVVVFEPSFTSGNTAQDKKPLAQIDLT
jgi:hypothetical protein